jgi:hypothetical protein
MNSEGAPRGLASSKSESNVLFAFQRFADIPPRIGNAYTIVFDAEIGFWAFWESANFGKDAVAGGIEYSLSRFFKGSSIGSSPATLGKAHVDDHAFN